MYTNVDRKTQIAYLIFCTCLLALAAILTWQSRLDASNPYKSKTMGRSQNTVLVQFDPDIPEAERDVAIAQMQGTMLHWFDQIDTAVVQTATGAGVMAANVDISALPVNYIENDVVVRATQSSELDPALFGIDEGYPHRIVQSVSAWEIERGHADTIIAVLDTGVNTEHPDLQERILYGEGPIQDFVNQDGKPMDDQGHGTHVAGTIGATAYNGLGGAGVCPHCSIMPLKVLDQNSAGRWSTVVAGILYAVDNGAKVINLSLGAKSSSITVEQAILYAEQKDVLIVAASGNNGLEEAFYPAAMSNANVLAVNATNKLDEPWYRGNYGEHIDITAPGHDIYSTDFDLTKANGGYSFKSGTSMATAYISGLAGLLFSQNPERTVPEVVRLITEHAEDFGEAGHDKMYGHGRINVYDSLLSEAPLQLTAEPSPLGEGDVVPPTGGSAAERLNNLIFLPLINH